jgi:hypothetical protein
MVSDVFSAGVLKTYVLPLKAGEDLPRLPAGEWHTPADLGLYGVRVIDKPALPAPGGQGYAFMQRSYHRNLYRIPLP